MVGLIASVLASLPAWGLSAVLDGHVSQGTDFLLSFVVWSIAYVPLYMWLKKLKQG
jgi:hypothetical protein